MNDKCKLCKWFMSNNYTLVCNYCVRLRDKTTLSLLDKFEPKN
jgi:hypothetical protein